MQTEKDHLLAVLEAVGMPLVPDEFSVMPLHQVIPKTTLVEIETFIRAFEQVTTRSSWQEAVVAFAPEIARYKRTDFL